MLFESPVTFSWEKMVRASLRYWRPWPLRAISIFELLDILRENGKIGHAQFIIATHSPILLAYEDAAIYSFDHSPARVIEYEETAHYQIYKQFLLER